VNWPCLSGLDENWRWTRSLIPSHTYLHNNGYLAADLGLLTVLLLLVLVLVLELPTMRAKFEDEEENEDEDEREGEKP
jgi:hypothetical protein